MKDQKALYSALEAISTIYREEMTDRTVDSLADELQAVAYLCTRACENNREAHNIMVAINAMCAVMQESLGKLEYFTSNAARIAYNGICEPEAVEGDPDGVDTLTEEELRKAYLNKHTNIQDPEDRQKILDLLLPALQATRAGEKITKMTDNKNGVATVYFGVSRRAVNIECDSGIAMIVDICRALM